MKEKTEAKSFSQTLSKIDLFASELSNIMFPSQSLQNIFCADGQIVNPGSFFCVSISGTRPIHRIYRKNSDNSVDIVQPFYSAKEKFTIIEFYAVKHKGSNCEYFSGNVNIEIRIANGSLQVNNDVKCHHVPLSVSGSCIPAVEYCHYLTNYEYDFDLTASILLPAVQSVTPIKITNIPVGLNIVGVKFPEVLKRLTDKTHYENVFDIDNYSVMNRYSKERSYYSRILVAYEGENFYRIPGYLILKYFELLMENVEKTIYLNLYDIIHLFSVLGYADALYDSDIPTTERISHYQNRWSLTQDNSFHIVSSDRIINDLDVYTDSRIRYKLGTYYVSNNAFIINRNELYRSILEAEFLTREF